MGMCMCMLAPSSIFAACAAIITASYASEVYIPAEHTASASHVAGKSPDDEPALGEVVIIPFARAEFSPKGVSAAAPAIPSPPNEGRLAPAWYMAPRN